jgi:ABC-type uncharacterized transport system auxiliary subunit
MIKYLTLIITICLIACGCKTPETKKGEIYLPPVKYSLNKPVNDNL